MDYIYAFGYLLSGFAILLVGGEALVKSAVSLALRWKIPASVIGLTIIAAGTSAPELVTSLTAALKEAPDIALGNIVGSNVFNMLAILGVASLLRPNKVGKTSLTIDLPFLLMACIGLIAFSYNGLIERWEGIVLVAALVCYLVFSLKLARKQGLDAKSEISSDDLLKNIWWDLGHLVVGLVALLGGAQLALTGGIQLGELVGLSERIIGVTIISVGTGLPELATSAIAAFRGRNDIAVSNVIGSNIMNTLAIAGTTSAVHPIIASEKIVTNDCAWMVASILIVFPILYLGKGMIQRPMGAFLVFAYISYIGFLLTTP